MSKICMDCYEIYRTDYQLIKGEYNHCPKNDCYGEVVEVDELLLPTIIELNKKGYTTEYCCSGHYYDKCKNTYIKFCDWVELPSTPNGFKVETNKHDDSITIRKDYADNETVFEDICKSVVELYEWAKSLEEKEEY